MFFFDQSDVNVFVSDHEGYLTDQSSAYVKEVFGRICIQGEGNVNSK